MLPDAGTQGKVTGGNEKENTLNPAGDSGYWVQ
jgi:hypothetical protein